MVQIKEEIVNAGHGYLAPSLFAVHSTANPGATARNHRDLWSRGYAYAVHLVSDWTEAIHCVPYDALCWQVGNGNTTCEGIEICEATNATDFWRGIDIAADVTAQRLKAHGWGVGRMHPHQWFSQVYGGSDHTDPIPYFSRYGYTWDRFANLVQEKMNGEDMPSAQEIAEAVWNFNQNGTRMRDRVQGIDQAANNIVQTVGDRVWSFKINGVQARDRLNGLDAIQAPNIAKQVAQLATTITAQQAAIDKLAESLGADPDKIAQSIQDAVKAKLDQLDITITTDDAKKPGA